MENELNWIGCAKLLESVILNAFIKTNSNPAALPNVEAERQKELKKIVEFSVRVPNPVLETYCDLFEKDERMVRSVLNRKAKEAATAYKNPTISTDYGYGRGSC